MPLKTVAPLLVAAALALTGCAATVSRPEGQTSAPAMKIPAEATKRVVLNLQLAPSHPQDEAWRTFKQVWVDIARERVSAQGLAFDTQDGPAKSQGEAGTLLVVKINDYRHVGVGARMWGGIMTGNAYIDADVQFRDLKRGTSYGERSYNTSSSAGHGVFGAMTPKQIYALVDEMLVEIQRR